MKKKKILIFLSIIFALVLVGFAYKYHSKKPLSKPNNDIWVETASVEASTVPLEVRALGTLIARNVKITPEVAGHVEKVLFQEGAFVKKGEVLFRLDDGLYKVKYQAAQARLLLSENNYKRRGLLLTQHVTTQQELDEALADVKEKRAETAESKLMLDKMKLLAPFDAKVGESKVNPGDYITIGQDLVTLTDTQDLRIQYYVPEMYFPLLKLGQAVTMTATAYPNKSFKGKLTFISPTINAENRSILLYATLPNDENLLVPGMFVNVMQSLGSEKQVLLIPARSLVPVLDGQQVYKVMDGKAYAVSVLIGKRIKESVQVVQGLSPGDIVITDGQLKVKNGGPIQIAKKTKVSD